MAILCRILTGVGVRGGNPSALHAPHYSHMSLPPGRPPQVKAGPAEHQNCFLGFPRVAFSNLPLSDFWPKHLWKQKFAGLEDAGFNAQLPISITHSQQGCQNLLYQTSAWSLKITVTKHLMATHLSAARTSAAGKARQQLELGVPASVHLGVHPSWKFNSLKQLRLPQPPFPQA